MTHDLGEISVVVKFSAMHKLLIKLCKSCNTIIFISSIFRQVGSKGSINRGIIRINIKFSRACDGTSIASTPFDSTESSLFDQSKREVPSR